MPAPTSPQEWTILVAATLHLLGVIVLPIVWFWRECGRTGTGRVGRKKWFKRFQLPFVLATVAPLMALGMAARGFGAGPDPSPRGESEGMLDDALSWLWRNPLVSAAVFLALSIVGAFWLLKTYRLFRASNCARTNAPDVLMGGIRWSFDEQAFDSKAKFLRRLVGYNEECSRASFQFDHGAVAVGSDKAIVQYAYWDSEEEDVVQPLILVRADGEGFITQGQLLYRVHNAVCERLRHEDKRYFEGLCPSGGEHPKHPEVPVFFLQQGS